MRKSLTTAMAAALASAVLVPQVSAQEDLTFGIGYNVLAVPFITAVQRGIREKAAELGIELVERDAAADTTQQAADIQDFLTAGVDGMIIAGNGEANTLGAARPALAAGIPIVAMVSKIGTQPEAVPQPAPNAPEGGIVAFVAQNEEYAGGLAAEMLMEVLPEGGRYAVVLGAPGYSENTTRLVEFTAALEAAEAEYVRVAEQPGNWVPEGGQSACQNMLAANPDIQVFYALSDDMGVGCARAITQAGSDAQVIGVGGAGVGLDAIRSGELYGTIWYSPETIGRRSVEALHDYLVNGTAPDDRYVTYEIFKVTADNVDEFTGEW